jgi:hypothetical protein
MPGIEETPCQFQRESPVADFREYTFSSPGNLIYLNTSFTYTFIICYSGRTLFYDIGHNFL